MYFSLFVKGSFVSFQNFYLFEQNMTNDFIRAHSHCFGIRECSYFLLLPRYFQSGNYCFKLILRLSHQFINRILFGRCYCCWWWASLDLWQLTKFSTLRLRAIQKKYIIYWCISKITKKNLYLRCRDEGKKFRHTLGIYVQTLWDIKVD